MNVYLMKKPKKLNAVSVTLGVMALVFAYACWFLVPMFWPIFQLTGMMRGACNDAYRQPNDERVLKKLLSDSVRTKLKLTKENFRLTRVPYSADELQKQERASVREMMQKRGKTCVIEMHYEDDYAFPLIGKSTHMVFDRTVEVDLEQVKWEKGCTCVTPSRP